VRCCFATMGCHRRRYGSAPAGFGVVRVALVLIACPHNASAFSVGHSNIHQGQQQIQQVPLFSSVASSAETGTAGVAGPPAIILDGLTCTHDGGTKYQLDKVSYNLPRGKRIGLVGKNGCGKSSLLKILAETCGAAGEHASVADDGVVYTGNVEKAKDCTVAYVEQEPPMSSEVTVCDALLGFSAANLDQRGDITKSPTGVYDTIRQYRASILVAETDPERFATSSTNMDEMDGWKVLARVDEISTRLRVKALEEQPLSTLSGGERKRVALAAAFIALSDEPNAVLLLDEPTNHLDLSAIRWLAECIKLDRKMTVLCVTHDRAFLDDICDGVIELDNGNIYSYTGAMTGDSGRGGYSAYLEGKEARLANEDAALRAASGKFRTELDWMRRQPQARQSKSKARIDAFYKLEKSTQPRAVEADLELNSNDGQRRIGKNVLSIKNASLRFGDKVILDDFTYSFNRGDRIGIVGSNGVGKSTFIKILADQQSVDSGSINTGETVVFGMYDQMGIEIYDEEQRVMDFVKERVEASGGESMAEAPQEAMKLLKRFQFSRQRWNERIALLSGGERRRLQLLAVLTKNPNFLILDEPSNDLDLDSLSALESYLAEYNGVLVVISHDRFFVDKVSDHLFVFEGNGVVKDYFGTLSDYAEALTEKESATDAAAAKPSSTSTKKQAAAKEDKAARVERRNAIKKINKEMSSLEKKIEKLKTQADGMQLDIDNTDPGEGWTVLAELTDKMNALTEDADEKEMRWLGLAEELEEKEAEEADA